MSVNGIADRHPLGFQRSVHDGQGRDALGVTEADPALPGIVLISLNAELIADGTISNARRSPMNLAMRCSMAHRCCARPVSRHSPW